MKKIYYLCACLASLACGNLTAQTRPEAIYGDYDTFWISRDNSTNYVTAQESNNLIGFTVGGKTYSTGVNDDLLKSKVSVDTYENYVAFPTSFNTTSTANNYLIGIPRYLNGVIQDQTTRPNLSCNTSLGYYLRDGKNGLDLGSAVFNIPKQELQFYVNVLADINPDCINDAIPAIVVTQVGAPSTTFDIFKFTDANGVTVGVEKQVNFSSTTVTPLGKALWSFYYAGNCPHDYNSGAGFSGTTRDIRVLTFKLSDFGITTSNYKNAVKFVQVLSGDSDVAFGAYSTKSMILYCLENGNATGTALDTKVGITSQGRAGALNSNWPMVRKGGYLALESNRKAFVPTRVTTAGLANITNPVPGMTVYDTTENCIKVYVNSTTGWKCFNKKTCP